MGGSKGGGTTTQQSTTTIPPEVLARYNAVNARAEQAASQPFTPYTGEFVAPVNATQQGGINSITNSAGVASPYYGAATTALNNGLAGAQPYYGTATDQVASGLAGGTAGNTAATGALNAGLAGTQPYNAAAGTAYTGAYAGAQPYNMGATGLALAGTQAVDPGALNIGQYMSPYTQSVINATLGYTDQQQAQQRNALTSNAILSGSFGGDRSGVAQGVLAGQQNLARSNIVSGLYNQNYQQALGAAQQQQGVGLAAGQANRAALQGGASQLLGIGSQVNSQGMGLGAAQQGLGSQIYNQGLGASQQYGNIGNAAYTQGLGAANANLGIGQSQFNMGNTAAGTNAALGTGLLGADLSQGQAQLGAGTVQQQTGQAQDTAVYNQFLQQQGYPFQVAQFLANIAEGTGALSGSSTTGSTTAPQPFFSDERLKENIKTIGHTKDGLKIIRFNYKGSPHTQIGLSAQDVEKTKPEAVGLAGGYKTVDYDRATRALGGAVANDNAGQGFAAGGLAYDPQTLSAILMAHQAMYPGAAGHGAAGSTGTPSIVPTSTATGSTPKMLQGAQLMKLPTAQPTGLKQTLDTVNSGANAISTGKSIYTGAKDAVVGTAADPKTKTPASGGLLGTGGKWDPDKGWIGRQTSSSTPSVAAPAAGAPTASASSGSLPTVGPDGKVTSEPLPPVDLTPSNDVASAIPVDGSLVDDATNIVARRGGRIRMKRAAGGGMPYGNASYIPEDLYIPLDPARLRHEQEDLVNKLPGDKGGSGGGGGGAGGGLGGLGSLFSMGKSGLGSIFGGGGGAADTAGADAAASAAADGTDYASLLADGMSAVKRGGRVKRADGGGTEHDNQWMEIPGQAIGTAVGAFYGGPIGGMAGGKAGKNAGATVGDLFGGNWNGVGQDMLSGLEDGLKPALQGLQGGMPGMGGGSGLGGGMIPGMRRGGRARYEEGGVVPFDPAGEVLLEAQNEPSVPKQPVPIQPSNVIPFKAREGLAGAETPKEPAKEVRAGLDADATRALDEEKKARAQAPAAVGLAAPSPSKEIAPDQYHAPDKVASRHWNQESGDRQFKPDGSVVTSPVGAVGRSQLYDVGPQAAKIAGVDWDPSRAKTDEGYNRLLGDTWLKHLNTQYGDPYKAVAAYNAGTGAVDRAVQTAQARGGNYWDYLPAETQNHLYAVSGGQYGKQATKPGTGLGAGTATALNVPAPDAGLGGASLAAPAAPDLSLPPKDVKKGDWLDRNERPIVTGLTFLGNMLGSKSHQLVGSIGEGIAAAAPVYAQMGFKQQEAGLQQQGQNIQSRSLDIQQRAQYMTLLTQLRTMQNARTGRGLPEDPQLAAQISHLAQLVAAPSNGPNGGGTSMPGLPPGPLAGQPSTAQAAPAASPAALPPQPAAGAGPIAQPPAGTQGAPPAIDPGLVSKYPNLREMPAQVAAPAFLTKIAPEENPFELYRRADAITDDGDPNGMHAKAVARADAAARNLKELGYALDKNGMPVMVPGWSETARAKQMIDANNGWTQREAVANNGRQDTRQSLDIVRRALEEYQTNALGEFSADVQRHLKALGIPVGNTPGVNASAVQELIKQTAAQAGAAGDTDMARSLSRMASIDPNKEPEANKQILAQSYAKLNAEDAKYKYLQPRITAAPQLDTPQEQQKWTESNPRGKFYEDAYKDLAVVGATPAPAEMKLDHTYIITPAEAPKYGFPRGAIEKPTKFKLVERDGKRGLAPVN